MNKSILVVDDEIAIRTILERFLGRRYNVKGAESGEKALALLKESEAPDCLILDLAMPGIDGFELIRKIRDELHLSRLPIIVLSSKESSADRIRSLKSGADDYVIKPFNPEELEARIESIFRRIG